MLEEIHVGFEDYENIVKEGKTYLERKELFWRCYAVNPKKEEVENMSLSEMVDYIKETDSFYEDDKKYIDKCIKLIEELKEVKMIDLKNVSIDCDTYGTLMVDYYVNCFERELCIVFFNIDKNLYKDIMEQLDQNYVKWHEIDTSECCEEFMIDNLLPYYKNHIACVIYENEEEEKGD